MKSFDLYPVIDLTVAHTNLKITPVRPLKWLQVWCDGPLNGITILPGTQSTFPISLSQVSVIPVVEEPDTLYLTNDVRAGRSKLILYFVHTDLPLNLTLGGWGISPEEIAVRNGSISRYDRRGDIVFSTQNKKRITDPLYQTAWSTGTISLSSDRAKSDYRSFKMTTAAVLNDFVALFSILPYANPSPHGLECSFYTISTTNYEWRFSIVIYTGARRYQGTAIYNRDTTTLSISVGTVPTVVALDAALVYFDNLFNQMKIVINPLTGKYVRLMVNDKTYDISNYDLESAVSATGPSINTYVRLTTLNVAGAVRTGYVDDMIITRNEP
jgi:hypothetical protein